MRNGILYFVRPLSNGNGNNTNSSSMHKRDFLLLYSDSSVASHDNYIIDTCTCTFMMGSKLDTYQAIKLGHSPNKSSYHLFNVFPNSEQLAYLAMTQHIYLKTDFTCGLTGKDCLISTVAHVPSIRLLLNVSQSMYFGRTRRQSDIPYRMVAI